MAKQPKKAGEQQDLIDVHPKNAENIVKMARAYKQTVKARLGIQKKEAEQKHELIETVEKAELTPLKGGVIKFEVDRVEIKVTPRDKLVQVKELDPIE